MLRDLKESSIKLTGIKDTNDSKDLKFSTDSDFRNNSEVIENLCEIAVAAALAGMKTEAETVLRFLSETMPENNRVQLSVAYALTLAGYPDAAITTLADAVQRRPESKFSACALCLFQLMRGDNVVIDILTSSAKSADLKTREFAIESIKMLRKARPDLIFSA